MAPKKQQQRRRTGPTTAPGRRKSCHLCRDKVAEVDYKNLAELRRRLVPLVHAKAGRVERPVKRITVRDSRSRWGSCGPDGGLSFSWRLVFAPPEVLDYLVAHEVAHLVHLNHGPRFWALARSLCDGPMEPPQAWLKANGETLLQYGA